MVALLRMLRQARTLARRRSGMVSTRSGFQPVLNSTEGADMATSKATVASGTPRLVTNGSNAMTR